MTQCIRMKYGANVGFCVFLFTNHEFVKSNFKNSFPKAIVRILTRFPVIANLVKIYKRGAFIEACYENFFGKDLHVGLLLKHAMIIFWVKIYKQGAFIEACNDKLFFNETIEYDIRNWRDLKKNYSNSRQNTLPISH